MYPDMRNFIVVVENFNTQDFSLFHGTSETADEIRQKGLLVGHHNAVFLTDNPELALAYAESDQDRTGNDNVVIVEIKVSSLDLSKLQGDIDHTLIDDWRESLRETDQCMYMDNIPPSSIYDIQADRVKTADFDDLSAAHVRLGVVMAPWDEQPEAQNLLAGEAARHTAPSTGRQNADCRLVRPLTRPSTR